MGDWKTAYGWIGHILVSADDELNSKDRSDHNLVPVPAATFKREVDDYESCTLDSRIAIERLGIIESESYFLACGCCFSEGFTHYGTVFREAEVRVEGKPASNPETEYVAAMKEVYGLDLPRCRIMIGCSSEQ